MIKCVSEEEIWKAIKDCDANKAPGLDGFNLLMFRKGWKFMKADLMKFFNEFYLNAIVVRSLNSTFITLKV